MTGEVTIMAMTVDHLAETMTFEQELFGVEAWTADSYRDELADRRDRHYIVAVVADPGRADPRSTDPRSTHSRSSDPRRSDPRRSDPRSTDPRSTDPRSTDPRSAHSRSTDPVGSVLGWAGLLVIGDTAQILTIGVVPAAQRRGIGQGLLDALLVEAVRRGALEVILEVRVDNAPARRLYERNRFRPLRTRRGYYDLGRVDALEMRRAL